MTKNSKIVEIEINTKFNCSTLLYRNTERQTDRQTDRQTQTDRHRQRDRETDRQTARTKDRTKDRVRDRDGDGDRDAPTVPQCETPTQSTRTMKKVTKRNETQTD